MNAVRSRVFIYKKHFYLAKQGLQKTYYKRDCSVKKRRLTLRFRKSLALYPHVCRTPARNGSRVVSSE